jgi:hypothetical protein
MGVMSLVPRIMYLFLNSFSLVTVSLNPCRVILCIWFCRRYIDICDNVVNHSVKVSNQITGEHVININYILQPNLEGFFKIFL